MDFLRDKNSQFIITSSPKIDDVISVLHAKCYEVLPIKGYFRGQFEDSCLAWGNFQPEEIKNDVLLILKLFNQECAIVKFAGETSAKKLFTDGSEKPLGILMYNTDSDNVSYLLNGVSFSFVETKQYWQPNTLEDFKAGMIVEYSNNNRWFSKEVKNPKEEWDSLFKLLCKYQKVRVAI